MNEQNNPNANTRDPRSAEEQNRAADQQDKESPYDLPTLRVKHGPGDYKIINRKDFDPKVHELIKGGEDQEQSAIGASERNPSGTFSEPTPSDIRFPNKDATEFENNHGAFVNKSAAQMREARDMPDMPGGLYPDGAMRVEAVGPNQHRVMSGTREVMGGLSSVDAERFAKMGDEEKARYVEERGGRAPEMKATRERAQGNRGQQQSQAQRDREPGTHMPGETGQRQSGVEMPPPNQPGNAPPRR